MNNWLFLWAARRPPIWDNITNNMNLALGEKFSRNGYSFPVHSKDIPDNWKEVIPNIDDFNGQTLDQFEAESFKYVLDSSTGNLIIKEHLQLPIHTNESNSRRIDLNEVDRYLENNTWVALGIVLSNIEIADKTMLAKSFYYTRDPNTLRIINLSGDNQPHDHLHLPVITYAVFKRTRNPNIRIVVVNPNLISLLNQEMSNVDGHQINTISVYSDNIPNFFLKPKIEGARVISNSVIFAENDFKIHEYVGGGFWFKNKILPVFPRTITSNFNYSEKDNIIDVRINQAIGYMSIQYDLDDLINIYDVHDEAGKYKIEFLVVRG